MQDTEDELEAAGKLEAGREQGAAARSLCSNAGEQEEEEVRLLGYRRLGAWRPEVGRRHTEEEILIMNLVASLLGGQSICTLYVYVEKL
jgi:hypothetical protein